MQTLSALFYYYYVLLLLLAYQTVLRLCEVTAVVTPCGSFLARMSILEGIYYTAQERPFVVYFHCY